VTVIEVDEVLSIGDNVKFGPFLNVTTLSFDSTSASGIITAIQHSFPSLKRFKMNVDLLPWAEADQLFHALTQCNACDTIEDINITSEFESSSDPCEPLTVVRQFLCFPRLRKLELSVYLPIYVDDDLLLQAMSCWPNIQHLHLDNLHTLPPPPIVTLRGVIAALRLPLCPHLQYLKICMDVSDIDIDPITDPWDHPSRITLDLNSVHVADPGSVAQAIFANLRDVRCIMFEEVTWRTGWPPHQIV
jgi:hypothetical protein